MQSSEHIDAARDEFDPRTVQEIANTDVLGLYSRTCVERR
jgi:hypothetical protein